MVACRSEIAYEAHMYPGIVKIECLLIEPGYGVAQIEQADPCAKSVAQAQAEYLGGNGCQAVVHVGKIGYGVKIPRDPGPVAVLQVENTVQGSKNALFIDAP